MKFLKIAVIVLLLGWLPDVATAHIPPAVVSVITRTPQVYLHSYTEQDIELLAKTVWGEGRGCSPDEQRLVVWVVIQRLEAGRYGNTIAAVVTKPNQFKGYRRGNPVCPEIYALLQVELEKWVRGGRPPTLEPFAVSVPYLYFDSGKGHNWYRRKFR